MTTEFIEPRVRITPDGLEAWLTVPQLEEGMEGYSKLVLLDLLAEKGIIYGVDEDAIEDLLLTEKYDTEVLVAEGEPMVAGRDGYYTYHFNQEFSPRPLVRDDGTVDYRSIVTMELVEEGQKIVTYTPAAHGKDGYTVFGTPIQTPRVRDLAPIRGKGFTKSDDGLTYFSAMVGKIIKNGDSILITPVHEVYGDADILGGNIDFRGDVIVHGDVLDSITIKASGSIVVDGVAENCFLEADGDIILKRGVKGGGVTTITTRKNLFAEFVEFSKVRAEGNVQADVFFDSDVQARGSILLTGKRASVIGGVMSAIDGIECQNLGNSFGVKTVIKAGIDEAIANRITQLALLIEEKKSEIERQEDDLKDFVRIERVTGHSMRDDPKRTEILRSKLKNSAYVQTYSLELARLKEYKLRGRNADIIVDGIVYPGVEVHIEDVFIDMKQAMSEVQYFRSAGKLEMISLKELL